MSLLVALDPSIRSCGLALFWEGQLVHASAVKIPTRRGEIVEDSMLAARALNMARAVEGQVHRHMSVFVTSLSVVTEWPQVYRPTRAKGDPNDLAAMAAVGTAVAALLKTTDLTCYTPQTWAGQVPKTDERGKLLPIEKSPRAHRVRSRLSGAELVVWEGLRSSDHDAVDSIGIGCHHLGRRRPAAHPAQ